MHRTRTVVASAAMAFASMLKPPHRNATDAAALDSHTLLSPDPITQYPRLHTASKTTPAEIRTHETLACRHESRGPK
jgi:hypothetical protein